MCLQDNVAVAQFIIQDSSLADPRSLKSSVDCMLRERKSCVSACVAEAGNKLWLCRLLRKLRVMIVNS